MEEKLKYKSFILLFSDSLADAKAYDKWDKENSDRPQKMPTLSTNPKLNRVGFVPLNVENNIGSKTNSKD